MDAIDKLFLSSQILNFLFVPLTDCLFFALQIVHELLTCKTLLIAHVPLRALAF